MVTRKTRMQRMLHDHLTMIARWGRFVGICTVLAGIGGFLVTALQRPVYRATVLMVIDQRVSGQDSYSDFLASTQLVTLYEGLVSQPVVLQHAAHGTQGLSAADLAAKLHVSALIGTPVLQIQVDDQNPARAAALANDIASAFIAVEQESDQAVLTRAQQQVEQELKQVTAEINGLTATIDDLRSRNAADPQLQPLQQQLDVALATRSTEQDAGAQLFAQYLNTSNSLRVFQPAVPPVTPDHPSPLLNSLDAAALGFVGAMGFAVLLQVLDDRIRTAEDLEDLTGLTIIGTVEAVPERTGPATNDGRSASPSAPSRLAALLLIDNTYLAERFRIVRTNLHACGQVQPLQTILVTSPTRGDGKTTTAINLAMSLAQAGKRVLLVDADLRHPTVHAYLDIDNSTGLSHLLSNDNLHTGDVAQFATLPDAPNLYVLPAGPTPPNPTELLGGGGLYRLVRPMLATSPNRRSRPVLATAQEREPVDVIVIDSAPVLDLADALVLAAHAEGTILVVDAGYARARDVRHAVDSLKQANARFLGVVLNRVKPRRQAVSPLEHAAYGFRARATRLEDLNHRVAPVHEAADQPSHRLSS